MNDVPRLSEADLTAALAELSASPKDAGRLEVIVVRPDRDLRELPVMAVLTAEGGIPGDRWMRHCTRRLADGALNPDTQLTLMNTRFLAPLAGPRERWPLAGDNLLVDLDLSEANLPVGQRLRIGGAVIEVTAEPHTGCAKFSRRFGEEALRFVNQPLGRSLRLRGLNARVITDGWVRVGDPITKC